MTGFLSPTHVLLLLIVVLLLFGAKRLPEFGRSLGSGMREFKDSINPGSHRESTALTAATPDRATSHGEVSEPKSVEQQPTAGGAPSNPAA
jgi:sec-independent protein translocase protein TatA